MHTTQTDIDIHTQHVLMWWYMLVILAVEKQGQEDQEFIFRDTVNSRSILDI